VGQNSRIISSFPNSFTICPRTDSLELRAILHNLVLHQCHFNVFFSPAADSSLIFFKFTEEHIDLPELTTFPGSAAPQWPPSRVCRCDPWANGRQQVLHPFRNVRRILVRGINAPLPPEAENILKI